MYDTIRKFEVPEGVDLELRLAGPIIRIIAWLIDFMIRLVFYSIAGFILTFFQEIGIGIFLIIAFIIEWLYPVLFEINQGATPGKKNLNLYVCHDDGTPINWQSSMLRNLLRVADILPFGYALGLITMLCNKDFKRLGDLAAGTVVVYRDKQAERIEIPHASASPLPKSLTLTEQRAILDFAERHEFLTEARQQELANILTDLNENSHPASVNELHQYANWLVKGQ